MAHPPETERANSANVEDFFNGASMRRDCRLRDDTTVHFYIRHLLHTLAMVLYTEWDDAVLVTSDGGGDAVCHSYRHFANRKIKRVRLPNEICCSKGFR